MVKRIWATGKLLIKFWAEIDGIEEEITREEFYDYKQMGVFFDKH